MDLRIEDLKYLMAKPSWYELAIPKADLEFTDYGKNVAMWQDITISLLRGYIDKFYKKSKAREEQKHLRECQVTQYNIGMPDKYEVEVRNDLNDVVDRLKMLKKQMEKNDFDKDIPLGEPLFVALDIDAHVYKPLLFLAEKDCNGRKPFVDDMGEQLVKVSPVPLNLGEKRFAVALREYCLLHQHDVLVGKQVYLLRNESKKGMGFFEANSFYPDFILWIVEGEKQYLNFIDPKGISHLKGFGDDKVQLFKYLQADVALQLDNPNLALNSFIISNTPMQQVEFWAKEHIAIDEFADNHILFADDEGYLDKMMGMVLPHK